MKNEEKKIKAVYIEPADYIPEDLRRKYKLGEFAEPENEEEHGSDEMIEDCGGIQSIVIPMLEEDKDPTKTLAEQRAESETEPSPAEYGRWGKVGIRFTSEPKDK